MIITCPQCIPHEFQDKKYGSKNRVANPVPAKGDKIDHRCTVCGNKK